MKNNISTSNILLLLCFMFIATALNSCKDDENSYEELVTYIRSDISPFNQSVINIAYFQDSIFSGSDRVKIPLRLTRPINVDVKVDLVADSALVQPFNSQNNLHTTLLPQQLYSIEANKISAGEYLDTVVVDIDKKQITSLSQNSSKSYLIPIRLISTSVGKLSNNFDTHYLMINTLYSNLQMGIPANSQFISNRDSWKITLEDGVEGDVDNLRDNKTNPDVALSGKPFWIMIDLSEEKTITGIRTNHWWGGRYWPLEIEILQSTDGEEWTSIGILDTPNVTTNYRQEIAFITPITTRYLKYQILKIASTGRTSITEFNIYEPQ